MPNLEVIKKIKESIKKEKNSVLIEEARLSILHCAV